MRGMLSKMAACAQRALLTVVLAVGLVPLPAYTGAAWATESAETPGAASTLSDGDYAAIEQSEANGDCSSGEALVVYHASGAAKGTTGALGIQSESDPLEQVGFGAANTWDLSSADSSATAAAAASDGALSVQSEQTGSAIASGGDVRVALVKRDDMSTADLVASLDALLFVECAQPNYLISRESLSDDDSGIAALASTAAGVASATTSSSATSSSLKSQKLVTQSLTPQSAITIDPFNSLQWGLSGTNSEIGGSTAGIGYKTALEKEATSTTTKDSVVVAVLDTGVDYNNPDLKDQMWTDPGTIGLGTAGSHGYNGVTGFYDPLPEAGSSHGTHCAGIMAAATNNGIGVASTSGANSHTQIMALRHEDSNGYLPTCASIACYEYLVRARAAGVNVVAVNCSWGTPMASVYDPVLDYAINQAGKAGVLSCFAAGNTGTAANHDYSGACLESPYYISVASSTKDAALWSSSCYDQTAVDVAAPGANILSTVPYTSSTEEFTPLLSYKAGKTTKDQGMYYYTDIASLGISGASGISYRLYDAEKKQFFTCDGAVTLDATGILLESNALKVSLNCDKITEAQRNPNYVAIVLSWPLLENPFKGAIDTDPSHYALGVAVSGVGFKGGEVVWAAEGLLSGSTNLAKSDSYATATADTSWFDCAPLTSLDTTSDSLSAQVSIEFGDSTDPPIPLTGTKSCLLTGYGAGKTTDPTKDAASAFVPYAFMSGTSMATPMITGSIAELAALYPNYTPLQLRGLVCGGTTPITTPTNDRYGNAKHTASDGRFTFEQALNNSTVNANTWSITTSGNQVTVHGYNLNGARLYVDDTSRTTVTATGTQADSITFTAASSLFDGKVHRFDVVDGTTERYYNASYVTPDSSKDTLARIGGLPDSANASTGKLVSTVDRLFYADGQGTYLYSCAHPSDPTGSWTKLAAPGAAFPGTNDLNAKAIDYACADGRIYSFASGDSSKSTSTQAWASIKCNIYSIADGTWSGWNEIGTVESKYIQAVCATACNGTVGCYVRGETSSGSMAMAFFAANYGSASFTAFTDQIASIFSLSGIGTALYSIIGTPSQTVQGSFVPALARFNAATGSGIDLSPVPGYSSVDIYKVFSEMIAQQTGAGNGLILAGISDTNLGDLQLIGTDAKATKLGDFGLSAADGLTVGSMVMHNGRLYLNCVDHATENGTGTGLYTLPSTAATKVATTDVTATAKAEAGGAVSVSDWRGGAGGLQAAALSAQSADAVDSVQMAGGDTATWTATPDAGYAFKGWYDASGALVSGSATYSAPVSTSTTLTAQFAAGTATAYTVRHFKQQPDGTYASAPDETETLSGATGTQTAAVAKSYAGFTAQSFSQATIAGDGTTAVDIEYKRNAYTVAFDGNGGSGTMESMAAAYGVAKSLPACAFARDGYTFAGWNTKADGTGAAIADRASVESLSAQDGATVTLYAQWTQGSAPAPVTPASNGSSAASTASTGDAALPWAIGLGALAALAAAGIALALRIGLLDGFDSRRKERSARP